ncbi:MAG: DUF167 domain-containing protein [Puniceicoccales bacterium]|jgi:uncharacterized protein (TIGR00251 family)|nr:DUF167 domain-containing protein [Puniceicoccales bacterium]
MLVHLPILVTANAAANAIVTADGLPVRIRVAAPPRDGRANEALVRFLATTLAIPVHSIAIVRGRRSRLKCVEVKNIDKETLLARLVAAGKAKGRGA